jgi:hypothetical protein
MKRMVHSISLVLALVLAMPVLAVDQRTYYKIKPAISQ